MPSDRSQILDLFASGRIDFGETERLLCLTSMRDRFLTLTVWAVLLTVAAWSHIPHPRIGEPLQAAQQDLFQSCKGTEASQDLQLFLNRFLGELP
jgi:hypothetical protein